ncbi:MAG: hypothetical protein J2O49_07715, partial [Sciscionella sp.]|nr:hypothetical protein [Sciscionella sp.]
MSITIPSEVSWLIPIVVGQSWPQGDEDKMRDLANAWRAAGRAVGQVAEDGEHATADVRCAQQGNAGDSFVRYWRQFYGKDDSFFVELEKSCNGLADSCEQTSEQIEYTKISILVQLAILAVEIAIMIANAVETFGASTAGIPPAEEATSEVVDNIFKQLLEKLEEFLTKNLATKLLKGALTGAIQGVIPDVVAQGVMLAEGHEKSWDFGKTGMAAGTGALSGVIGAGTDIGAGKLGIPEGTSVAGKA